MVTPSSKEATGSVIKANLDPENSPSDVRSPPCVDGVPDRLLTGPCDRSRVGIGVTYAAGGASLTGENHIPRAVDHHLTTSSRNVSQRHCGTDFTQNLGNLICKLTENMVFLKKKIHLISNTG